ncbi:MAG: hypothetical protein ABR512_13305, partial [Desulfopila sp.]
LSLYDEEGNSSEWWVIASQTCNLYNASLDNVPKFEIVAAKQIKSCNAGFIRGDHPRILHVEAQSQSDATAVISLELDIQNRKWCKREILAQLEPPKHRLIDVPRTTESDGLKKLWLDNFICWLTRSYNRVTLPDQFNDAVRVSKIEDVFKKKLSKSKEDLWGIYFSIHPDSDEPQEGMIGEMPPPYQLNIVIVVNEGVDPEKHRKKMVDQLFKDEVRDPEDSSAMITRLDLAKRHKIRLIEQDIDALSVAEFTIKDHKSLIRYSFIDYLSDSSLTLP